MSNKDIRVGIARNSAYFDLWSIVHFLTGIVMASFINPLLAFVLMVLWEPIEILVLSPILGRHGVLFGYETLVNSLSDIVVDTLGILVAVAWIIPR
jgi:hypothetical protein